MRTVKPPPSDASPLAREAYRLMTEGDLSMLALSKEAGVSYDFVRDILRSKSRKPNAEELGKLAAFFKRSTEVLLDPGRPEQIQDDEKQIKTPEELTWVRIWRRASDIGRARLIAAVQEALLGDLRLSGEAKDI